MAILTALALVWNGLLSFFGKAWEVLKEIVGWFIQVMPAQLRFVFFLYLILFFSSMIVPRFVGIGMACDSSGTAYSFNVLDSLQQTEYLDSLGSICGVDTTLSNQQNQSVLLMPISFFLDSLHSVFSNTVSKPMTIKQFYDLYKNGDFTNDTLNDYCMDLRVFVNSNPNELQSRDFVLQHFGVPNTNKDYKSLIHVQCSKDKQGDYYPTLYVYNIDIFSFDLWLMLGVSAGLCWFAVWWYGVTIKK